MRRHVWPKHFRFLLFMLSLGVRSPWVYPLCTFTVNVPRPASVVYWSKFRKPSVVFNQNYKSMQNYYELGTQLNRFFSSTQTKPKIFFLQKFFNSWWRPKAETSVVLYYICSKEPQIGPKCPDSRVIISNGCPDKSGKKGWPGMYFSLTFSFQNLENCSREKKVTDFLNSDCQS